jgi:hypothetical protein
MSALNDLNALTLAMTVAALVIGGAVIFLNIRDRLNHWPIEPSVPRLAVWYLAAFCLAGAVSAYSPSANLPRKTAVGGFRIVGVNHSRGGDKEFICIDDCSPTGGYALSVSTQAARVLDRGPAGARYWFIYLDHADGNALTGVSKRLVGISNPDTGESLYRVDLSRHALRMAVFLGDAALLIFAGCMTIFLARRPKKEDSESEEESEDSPRHPAKLITSLDLESGEK